MTSVKKEKMETMLTAGNERCLLNAEKTFLLLYFFFMLSLFKKSECNNQDTSRWIRSFSVTKQSKLQDKFNKLGVGPALFHSL